MDELHGCLVVWLKTPLTVSEGGDEAESDGQVMERCHLRVRRALRPGRCYCSYGSCNCGGMSW